MLKFSPAANEYERLAFGAVLIPDTLNVYGDFHTKESVRQFAYGFMLNGFKIDVDHDNEDVGPKVRIVESFLARPGDPNFPEGSWVVGIHVLDDALWADILSGELNGFSYEALVSVLPIEVLAEEVRHVSGETFPDIVDGHTHKYFAVLSQEGRVVTGGTDLVDGHSHEIDSTTYTALGNSGVRSHRHRFPLLGERNGSKAA